MSATIQRSSRSKTCEVPGEYQFRNRSANPKGGKSSNFYWWFFVKKFKNKRSKNKEILRDNYFHRLRFSCIGRICNYRLQTFSFPFTRLSFIFIESFFLFLFVCLFFASSLKELLENASTFFAATEWSKLACLFR